MFKEPGYSITADKTKIIADSSGPVMIRQNICNLDYLVNITRGNKENMNSLLAVFLEEIPKELSALSEAIKKSNYTIICNILHKIRSSFSIMGISVHEPVLAEMEKLGSLAAGIEKIKQLNRRINVVFKQAKEEMKLIN